jgi:hypothetical protein
MTRTRSARVAGALLIGLVGLGLTSCGTTIKPDATAKFVTDNVAKKSGFTPKDVTCPDGIEAKEGVGFDCHFTGPDGPYTAHLTILKVNGADVSFQWTSKPDRSGQ